MLPNFLVVGAPKAGTTSLYHYLTGHPQVFMSTPKEVNFFSREEIEAQGLYYRDLKVRNLYEYEKLFETVTDEKAIGEGSVSYLYYPDTPLKIKCCLPEVKIIIILRDPVNRGFSHYLMDKRLGLVDASYDFIIRQSSRNDLLHLYYQQYVEVGLYYDQVKRYLDIFSGDSVKIILQEDLQKTPEKVIFDLFSFLNIDISYKPDLTKRHNMYSMPKNGLIRDLYSLHFMRSLASKLLPINLKQTAISFMFERGDKPVLNSDVRDSLIEIYRLDIQMLEKLIRRDLSSWYQKSDD